VISRRAVIFGAAASCCPLTVGWGQPVGKPPRIGVLWHAGNAAEEHPYFGSLLEGFRGLGYVEGRSIVLDHRFPNEMPDLFTAMASELVASKVDVLVGVGSAAPYAKKATANIPIVFMYVPDPVGANLVQSVSKPGGNATGLTNFSVEVGPKRLEYLKEFLPTAKRVALLVNPNAKISELYISQGKTAAAKLGLSTHTFEMRKLTEVERAFDEMAKAGMQAVVVNAESLFYQAKEKIAQLAIAHRLPTCVWVREVLEAGALLSYGVDQRAIARRVAVYVDRILKGEKPAEMPVEQPTRFELVVNARTAGILGLTIPRTLLLRADEVLS